MDTKMNMHAFLKIPHRARPSFCLLLILGTSFGQTKITGNVVDLSGDPVAHASVQAVRRPLARKTAAFGDRLNSWIRADTSGAFVIWLDPGRYKIRAKDEALGYPDPVYWLNADPSAVFPEIVVSAGETEIQGVKVVLGKPGGFLSRELLDQETRAPVAKGKITLRDAQNPNAYVEVFSDVRGHFEFAVPSKSIVVSASAEGYTPISLSGGDPVVLSGGSIAKLSSISGISEQLSLLD
jgi:hypothetical protein